MSHTATLAAFLERYAAFIGNCASVMSPGGKSAILMGNYCDRESGFVSLTYYTKQLAFAAGLRQCCPDIIRFSHVASSSRKVYRSSFIPGLHDVCMVFERPQHVARGMVFLTDTGLTFCRSNVNGLAGSADIWDKFGPA